MSSLESVRFPSPQFSAPSAPMAPHFGMSFRVVQNRVEKGGGGKIHVVPYVPKADEEARPMSDLWCPRRLGNAIVSGVLSAVSPWRYAYRKYGQRTLVADGVDAQAIRKTRVGLEKPGALSENEQKLWLNGAKSALGFFSFTRWFVLPRRAVILKDTASPEKP